MAQRLAGQRHCIPHPDFHIPLRDQLITQAVLERAAPHLTFTPEEEETGRRIITALGISEKQPFICFHSRDAAYLEKFPGNWHYHDYRDSSIASLIPAMEKMVDRGYVAVRMGSAVKESLGPTRPGVIDYAGSPYRSDFMDIYLSSRCAFFLSTASGIMCPSLAFRRPQCFVSTAPVVTVLDIDSQSIFLPKLHWLKTENRYMTFCEIFATGASDFGRSVEYEKAGIELIPNTPDEIAAAVMELDNRLNGSWIPSREDEELQAQFWSLVPTKYFRGKVRSRIGAAFLRLHRDLLN
ncbi:MAG: TIGR04372 family glycosyltransferase [Sterolibacteriaceae bacterium MAG5]|nr:TIGR04372 family glycosyltransferase [Candidatus Nitricoxidireducens bremensis]